MEPIQQLAVFSDGTAKGTHALVNGQALTDVRRVTVVVERADGFGTSHEIIFGDQDFAAAKVERELEESGACLSCRGKGQLPMALPTFDFARSCDPCGGTGKAKPTALATGIEDLADELRIAAKVGADDKVHAPAVEARLRDLLQNSKVPPVPPGPAERGDW